MTFVDFSDYGLEDSMPYEADELMVVYLEAQMLMARNGTDVCRRVLEKWELALEYQAQQDAAPSDDWLNSALLCIAMRGCMGDRAPKFFDLSQFR